MAPKKRAVKKSPEGQPAPKRPRKQDDPVWCTESKRSPLVHDNLHALYSDPKTYENWTKENWEKARQCLPDDAPYSEDGHSVPITYFKYDVDWRRHVREFQEHLGAGRYEPEWIEQASQAMEERARGDFDSWKAKEFETFWGQKQKTDSLAVAGESALIKLETLIEHGVIKVGDIFSYERVFGRRENRVMVEKDARVVKIEDRALKMAIPPGQLKYARYLPTPDTSSEKVTKEEESTMQKGRPRSHMRTRDRANVDDENRTLNDAPVTDTDSVRNRASGVTNDRTAEAANQGVDQLGKKGLNPDTTTSPTSSILLHPAESGSESTGKKMETPCERPSSSLKPRHGSFPHKPVDDAENLTSTTAVGNPFEASPAPLLTPNKKNDAHTPAATVTLPSSKPVEDVVLLSISTLGQLEKAMVEIDGRLNMKAYKSANAWKTIRGKRNNQDMGSLFDMREDFFVNKSPSIVKEAKVSKTSGRELRPTKRQ